MKKLIPILLLTILSNSCVKEKIIKPSSSITKVDKLEKNNRDLLRIQETQLMLNNDRLIDQFFEVLNQITYFHCL